MHPLRIVQDFARTYSPTPKEDMVVTLIEIPDTIVHAFIASRQAQLPYQSYLSLIFVRIHRYQLTCCHQFDELRKNNPVFVTPEDPLVYELMPLDKTFTPGAHMELLTSAIILKILPQYPELRADPLLKAELAAIALLKKHIAAGNLYSHGPISEN